MQTMKTRYCIRNSQMLILILARINPVPTLMSFVFTIFSIIILPSNPFNNL
jgi:hypothetical protein